MKRMCALTLLMMLALLVIPAMAEEAVTIPDLSQYVNLPDVYCYQFADMGVDAEGMMNAVPQSLGMYKDGSTLYVPDRGYTDVLAGDANTGMLDNMALQDGMWVLENCSTAEEDLYFSVDGADFTFMYYGDTLNEVRFENVTVHHYDDYLINYPQIGWSLTLLYDDESLTGYEKYAVDEDLTAYYLPDGVLEYVQWDKSMDGMFYKWNYRAGWSCSDYMYGDYENCTAPAEYAGDSVPDRMNELFSEITVEGVPVKPAPILPGAVEITVPATPETLPRQISELNIDFAALKANLPNSDGVAWDNGLPVVEDHGYDSVAVTDSWALEYYPMVLENGSWVVPDGTTPYEPFYEEYGARITIGDVTYEYEEGALKAVILGDYLRYYVSGTYRIDLEKENGEVGASYDKEGSLFVEEYFPKWLDWQVFFYIKADGSIDYLLTTPNWSTVYYWFPDRGWSVGGWTNNEACDAPELFADVTDVAQWCYDTRDRLMGSNGGDDSGEGEEDVTAPTAYVNVLPADLTVIEAEAFLNADITDCDILAGVTTIGAAAFKGCTELTFVRIPATVTDIATDAFDGCAKLVIVCEAGSEAETFAKAKGITCITE